MGSTVEGQSNTKKYVIICVVLCVITLAEYIVFEIPSLRSNSAFMYPVLGVLSLVKFVLVCGWYMHLKGDNPLLTWIYIAGISCALMVYVILALVTTGHISFMPPGAG